MAAAIAHEVLGHGGACLALGGQITLVSSVYFRSRPPSYWVDVAGPLASLLVGGGLYWYLRSTPRLGRRGLVGWFTMAFTLCWFAGYLLLEALTNLGDLALPMPGRAATLGWRVLLGGLGVLAYHVLVRRAALATWPNTLLATYQRRGAGAGLLVVPYLAASLAAFAAAAWYAPGRAQAMWETSGEILGAASPLLFLVRRLTYTSRPAPAEAGKPDWLFLLAVGGSFLGFCLVLGRGVTLP